jgi:pimeloyl-ACP methyl ester carboxylesterase
VARRSSSEVWPLAVFGPVPEATPVDPDAGPDTYGNPDPEWLRIDWREHLRTTDVVGTRVNYVEMGTGPPLLLVHGLSGCWQNWLENIPYLARRHRVVAPDLPGFGGSPMPSWEISIGAYARLIHDFCERLGLRRVSLIGNSMGGFISAEATIREPQRVEKLVLVSAAGVSHARMRREPAVTAGRMAAAAAPYALRFHEVSMIRPRLRQLAFRGLFWDPLRLRPELLWEFLVPGVRNEGFLPALEALVGYDFLDRLPEIEVPTLIVWGRQDRVVPAADASEYNRLIPSSRLVVFDRCGHIPQAERPARFNSLVERFLAE